MPTPSHIDTNLPLLKINRFPDRATFDAAVANNLIGNDELSIILDDIILAESVTYSQLVTLKTNSDLEPNKMYRITDYETKTTQSDTQSAGHVFDLVVRATSTTTLDNYARALLHSGDTYFSGNGCDLSKWQIWYDINNDTTKYAWADTTNGKGVIYRMIDEYGNDCSYDFKNIQYKKKLTNGEYDPTNGTDQWVYTFTATDINSQSATYNEHSDASVLNGLDVDGDPCTCNNNILRGNFEMHSLPLCQYLTYNVFLGLYDLNNSHMFSINNNKLGYNCIVNTFGNFTQHNFFGDNCSNNIFAVDCNNNVFGNECENIKFGAHCSSNIFGNNNYNVILGTGCSSNVIGNNGYTIKLGDNSCYNILQNFCQTITLGSYCTFNIIKNNCRSITFGNGSDLYGNYARYVIFENGCAYIKIYNSSTADATHYLQNIYIVQGLSGAINNDLVISSVARALTYRTTVGKDSTNTLQIYCEEDQGGGGGGSSTLAGLTDTTISSPSDTQVLRYNSSTQKWVNSTKDTTVTIRNWTE